MTTRRALVGALGACLLAPHLGALAQQAERVWRVGLLFSGRRPASLEAEFIGQVPDGLRALGYVEGRNLVLEWRFADGEYDRLPGLALELARIPVDVLVSLDGTPPALAARNATTTIPIVFVNVADPVASGLARTLARPGGNATGFALLSHDTTVKQLDLLCSVVAGIATIAVFVNPVNPATASTVKTLQEAAWMKGVKLEFFETRNPAEISSAFQRMAKIGPGALLLPRESLLQHQRALIADLATKARIPSIGGVREYAEAGGLMGYGANRWDTCRRAASYIDRILRGAKPGDLPVEQPTRFEFVLNRRTARALGITIPPELLLLADRVIE